MSNRKSNVKGVSCPNCGQQTVRVTDSRDIESGRFRRRICMQCHCRWSTVEVPMETATRLTAALSQIDAALMAIYNLREAVAASLKGASMDEWQDASHVKIQAPPPGFLRNLGIGQDTSIPGVDHENGDIAG